MCFTLGMKCSSCKQDKPQDAFYKVGRRCRECRVEYQRKWQAESLTPEKAAEYRARFAEKNPGYSTLKRKEWAERNPEKAKEIDRRKYEKRKAAKPPKVERTPLTIAERKQRYYEKYPIKAEARKIYKYALKTGKLVREPCRVCGALEVDGHHEDYYKPLEVVWLCRTHHAQAHKDSKKLDI